MSHSGWGVIVGWLDWWDVSSRVSHSDGGKKMVWGMVSKGDGMRDGINKEWWRKEGWMI